MKKPPLLLLVLLLSWGAASLGWVLEELPGDGGRRLVLGVPLKKALNETVRARRELRAAPVTYDRREEVEGRYISYNELGAVDRFSSSTARSYRQLLFDTDNYQLLVGARDHIYRLSLTGFHVLESATWAPDTDTTRLCEIKGQDSYHCHNFVTLLEKHGDRLLACGTYAFRPMCSWRSVSSIATVEDEYKGVGQSPFDPAISSAYVMSGDGNLFVGTSNDFHGRDPAVMRVGGLRSFLRTNQYDYKWLSQPTFVAAFESGGFVYFFLKENAVEYLNCGERVYPRIVRVCKDDPGGSRGHTDKWTTFLKARLDCSLPGHAPFYYDSLESVEYLPAEDVFYALFTTQRNGVAGSAVCAFNMTSINKTFDGPFKVQSNPGSAWTPVYEDLDHYRCQYGDLDGDPSLSSRASVNANKYQLMDADVQPVDTLPVYTLNYERLTHLAVDVVPTRQSGSVHVLYMAGADATIRKVSLVPRSSRTVVSNRNASTTCLLEVIAPFPTNLSAKIHTMQFLRETHSLYIGTEHEVLRLPVHRCHRYRSRASCLSAHDPYCGWDRNLLECSPPPQHNPFGGSWVQEVIDCPTNTEPVDGGWAPWSPWSPCQQSGSDDQCQCRQRVCDAPAPARGGAPCEGHYTEVSNCTVHGGWTQWSAWSQCSASCGVAVKSRRRSCTNPAPQHGGRVCVGLDHNEIYCHLLPPCPVSTHLPISGGWGPWSPWSTCSSECGRGTRRRTRLCNDPRPKHGGALCAGCDEQVEECVSSTCGHSSLEESSDWTPWLVDPTSRTTGSGSGGGFVQKRYRAQCKLVVDNNNPDTPKLRTTIPREERFCSSTDSCALTASDSSVIPGATYVLEGVWEEWSDWSACDRECGTGQQSRWRVCASKKCEGDSVQHRTCNSHPCKGEWSCWSEWSSCFPHCGAGLQRRRRECLASRHPPLEASDCTGHSEMTKRCKGKPCAAPAGEEGWGQWSAWSGGCGGGATFRTRSRDCVVQDSSICRGLDHQKQSCQDVVYLEEGVNGDYETVMESEIGNSELQSEGSAITAASVSVGSLTGACVGCLFLGVIVGALGMHILTVRQRHRQVPSSPHYLSVKQNQYVTVPGTHWKKTANVSATSNSDEDNNHHHHLKSKSSHQLSGTPTSTLKNSLKRQSSTRDPYTTLPLKEIDTATIKRSTHSSYGNGHIRADLDSDTIFNF